MVYIKDSMFEDVVIEEVVSEETKRNVMKKMSETFDSIRSGKEFNTKSISITIEQLLDEIMKK